MRDIALSTMWGLGRYPNLNEFFVAASQVGFKCFELNHGVDSAMLSAANLNGYRIASVHAPCPADLSPGALRDRDWLISSLDEENRKQGVEAVRRSIRLARELHAEAVIVHPGQVSMDTSGCQRLRSWYKAGKAGTLEYTALRAETVAARAAAAGPYVEAVRKSLRELAEDAARAGVRLGLENRYYYHEIPLPDDLESLLREDWGGVVGYWYDVGHAHTLAQLGYVEHGEWLARFARYLVGIHLHDANGIEDHHPVGFGQVDWAQALAPVDDSVLLTCEFQNVHDPEKIRQGLARVDAWQRMPASMWG